MNACLWGKGKYGRVERAGQTLIDGDIYSNYKVTKEKGIKSMRDTVIKIPETDNKNGAI